MIHYKRYLVTAIEVRSLCGITTSSYSAFESKVTCPQCLAELREERRKEDDSREQTRRRDEDVATDFLNTDFDSHVRHSHSDSTPSRDDSPDYGGGGDFGGGGSSDSWGGDSGGSSDSGSSD